MIIYLQSVLIIFPSIESEVYFYVNYRTGDEVDHTRWKKKKSYCWIISITNPYYHLYTYENFLFYFLRLLIDKIGQLHPILRYHWCKIVGNLLLMTIQFILLPIVAPAYWYFTWEQLSEKLNCPTIKKLYVQENIFYWLKLWRTLNDLGASKEFSYSDWKLRMSLLFKRLITIIQQ